MKHNHILITGGAGFIGTNLAHRLLNQGHELIIFDNLSRSGCESNLTWLREVHGSDSFRLVVGDVTDFERLKVATDGVDRVYHLAAQVAVTDSVRDPRYDFQNNALGTFNALEAARLAGNDPIFIYSSTNKVYGKLEGVEIVEETTRYQYAKLPFGISETHPIDFHSPYGCSKGAGDQYVHDYSRIYGLRTVVARQSCIYGYRQFGIEDQGWVAWFVIAALKSMPITIFGDGRQVRDILFIDDLIDFYELAIENITNSAGKIYNVGGGPHNTVSIWAEFSSLLEGLVGRPIQVKYRDWRPGDQYVYVSDIRKAEQELGWRPRISIKEGLIRQFNWIREHERLFHHF
jgi:CDP-paratose 2-epimerase